MRRLVFTCDGCDLNEHITLSADRGADGMIKGWIAHHVVAYENGSPTCDMFADLCPACSNKFRHAINPAKWPRMEVLLQAFGKKPAA